MIICSAGTISLRKLDIHFNQKILHDKKLHFWRMWPTLRRTHFSKHGRVSNLNARNIFSIFKIKKPEYG